MIKKILPISIVAMLRGVNVGGKIVSMERLRDSLAGLGFENVRTYIQSGNVVFNVAGVSSDLSKRIENTIFQGFHLPVSVILRTSTEMKSVIGRNPYAGEPGIDQSRLHVTFLSTAPARGALKALAEIPAGTDTFRHSGKEIYLYCPTGYGKTKLSNNMIEKVLATRATTRNWNTVGKLFEMSRERGD
jgi:uncharacterized protein (DUF1697 family)